MKIFEKGKIGSLEIKNRLIMVSLTTNLSHDTGEISHRDLAFYKERIDGGVGAIITGMMRVDDYYGRKFPYQPSATHSKYIRGMRMLTDLAHASDVKIFAQVNHPGAQTFRELNHHLQQVSAIAHRPEFINQESRPMTDYEISIMIRQFVRSAIICQQAGFDGVEIHAGHGYLLHSFLQNPRGDDILYDLLARIRSEVGDDFTLILRLNFDDFTENGIKIDQALATINHVKDLVDAIDITCGVYESMYTICDAKYYPNRWKDDFIRKIRANTSLTLIADNNIKNPAEAEDMLGEDMVDFVGLGRPLLADPNWVNKIKSAKPIAPCISCSHCFRAINDFKPVQCPVNPHLSRESLNDRAFQQANDQKTMLIIGAGPAGCQMAISLAEKGYKVVLFEKEKEIGGKLHLAAKTSGKYRINNYLAYLKSRITDLRIDTRLNQVADVDQIKAMDPYQVFIATGSKNESLDKAYGLTATELLNGEVEIKNQKVLIIGGGENGLELAETLDPSNQITIAEATNMLGREMEYGERMMLLAKLESRNVEILTNTLAKDIGGKKVVFASGNTKENRDFDAIIKTIRPVTNLAENSAYLTELKNPIIIGDADNIGKIWDATNKAVEIASRY